jgi:transposase
VIDGFRLTVEKVRSLRALHRRCRDRRLADRVKAVVLLGTGWTVPDAAEALLLEEDTVRSYRQAYQQGGADLLWTVRYQGSEPKLNPDQTRELDQHLSTTTYLRVQDLVAYVRKTFRVVYTVAGMTDFLKRLDYVYKKPTLTPGQHPDLKVQQAFIADYQTLKESKGQDDPIYFMEGVHPRHNPVAADGWI